MGRRTEEIEREEKRKEKKRKKEGEVKASYLLALVMAYLYAISFHPVLSLGLLFRPFFLHNNFFQTTHSFVDFNLMIIGMFSDGFFFAVGGKEKKRRKNRNTHC